MSHYYEHWRYEEYQPWSDLRLDAEEAGMIDSEDWYLRAQRAVRTTPLINSELLESCMFKADPVPDGWVASCFDIDGFQWVSDHSALEAIVGLHRHLSVMLRIWNAFMLNNKHDRYVHDRMAEWQRLDEIVATQAMDPGRFTAKTFLTRMRDSPPRPPKPSPFE